MKERRSIIKKVYSFFKRDNDYWNSYYKRNPPKSQSESLFAQFVGKYVQSERILVDLGCGNGRDSFFFNKHGLDVIGIDASESAITALSDYASESLHFICGDFVNEDSVYNRKVDYFYSRFTIHAIDEDREKALLKNVYQSLAGGGMFFIEVRGIHDDKYGKGEKVGRNTYLLDGHFRRFININEFLNNLIETGFYVKYAEEAKGFAPYKNEDSEIIRVVVEKLC